MELILHSATILLFGFIALLISTNMLGKTQISQVTPFHFISALVLGELLGNAVYDKEINVFMVLFSIAIWTLLMFLIEVVTQKFRKARGFFEGNPSIVINKGQIDYNELKKNRMDLNELQSLLRGKNVFAFNDIEYAILEPNGSVSVLKKQDYNQPTKKDLNLSVQQASLPVVLISDGELLVNNLESLKYNEDWIKKQLLQNGIKDIKEVFYAEWDTDTGLYISKKQIQ